MYLTKEVKAEIFAKHGGAEANTGKSESQIALFTFIFNLLTVHLYTYLHHFISFLSLL